MTLVQAVEQIEYPESDGEPMGETDLHRNWMVRIYDMLSCRFRGEQVYVGSNLIVYFEEGHPYRCVVPDVFVALDCPPGNRSTFMIWEEGLAPTVTFEVTSRNTRRHDLFHKPRIYSEIGVREYFLYDPTFEYLLPPLRGSRLEGGTYAEIEPDFSGRLPCEALGLGLCLEAGRLAIYDQRTGLRLLTEAEIERKAREAERQAREAAELRVAEERRARQMLEEEVRRLRAQIERSDAPN